MQRSCFQTKHFGPKITTLELPQLLIFNSVYSCPTVVIIVLPYHIALLYIKTKGSLTNLVNSSQIAKLKPLTQKLF